EGLPDWEGLFAMGDFVHKTHRFAYQNEYKSPASRPGFCIFSALNHQYCSGQLNPDTCLGRTSALAGGIPSLW
ncbi:hypothetical protein ACET7L_21305, partial [Aeromonas veronii]